MVRLLAVQQLDVVAAFPHGVLALRYEPAHQLVELCNHICGQYILIQHHAHHVGPRPPHHVPVNLRINHQQRLLQLLQLLSFTVFWIHKQQRPIRVLLLWGILQLPANLQPLGRLLLMQAPAVDELNVRLTLLCRGKLTGKVHHKLNRYRIQFLGHRFARVLKLYQSKIFSLGSSSSPFRRATTLRQVISLDWK